MMKRKIRIYVLAVMLVAVAAAIFTELYGVWKFPEIIIDKGISVLLNSIAFALYCAVLVFSVISGRNRIGVTFARAGSLAVWTLFFALAGKLVSCHILPEGKLYIILAAMALVLAVLGIVYFKCRKRSADKVTSTAIRKSAAASGELRYTYSFLYASLTLLMAADIYHLVSTFGISFNYGTLIPLAVSLLSLAIWRTVGWRGAVLVAVMVDIFFAYILIDRLFECNGFASFGLSLSVFFVFVSLVLPLADLYCRKERNI